MPQNIRPWLGWSLMLSLSTAGLSGCSSEEPAAAPAANNQAQANAPAGAAAMPAGGMMPGMPGAPGGMPGAPGGAVAPAGAPAAPADPAAAFAGAPAGALAPLGAPAAPADPAAAFRGAPGGAVKPAGAPAAPGDPAAAFAGAPFAGAPGAVAPGTAPGAAPAGPGAIGGQGASQSPQSKPGTAGFPAEKVVLGLMNGDVSGLEEFISSKCKNPLLSDVRDGKATEKQIEDLKKLFTGLNGGSAPRNENGTWSLSIRNADNANISFKVKKEADDYKVIEMTVKAGTAKKNR